MRRELFVGFLTPVIFAMLALSAHAQDRSSLATIFLPESEEIQLALEAGPQHMRAQAGVYVFDRTGYRKVRSASNGFTCIVNRDGNQLGDNDLKPTCWDGEGSRTIVPVMLRVGELIASGADADSIKQDIAAGFACGKYSSPQKAGIAYMLKGDFLFDPRTQKIAKQGFPPHYMIYSPGVSNADIGMDVEQPAGPFSLPKVFAGYSGGSRTAYIIVVAAPSTAHAH